MATRVFIVAGEASADAHAANLLRELRSRVPDLEAYGVGGTHMERLGFRTLLRAEDLSAVGITDWVDRLPSVWRAYRALVRNLEGSPPDLALLLDLPDFNLRIASHLHRLGVPVVYYISPQVWAWRKYRVRHIRKVVDKMLVVFPFEESFYRQRGVSASFVGHPLVDRLEHAPARRDLATRRAAPRIALLPGSRLSELRHHGPMLEAVAERLLKRYPKCEFRVPVASTLSMETVRAHLRHPALSIENVAAESIYRWADCGLVASGTATLEAALVGMPMALLYKFSPVSGWVLKHLVRYQGFLGMPNVLLGRECIREFIQDECREQPLEDEIVRLLEDDEYRREVAHGLEQCRALLGSGDGARRAADEVMGVLHRTGSSIEPARA